ncbi:MAG: helix-turn-helix transcriptional regulator [Janthinobacterium lividum]
MSVETVLDRAALPETFECVVKAEMELPAARIEIHDYRFHQPQQALFRSSGSFLDLALSHRPGHALGRYLDLPGHVARPMGDVIFIPDGQRLSSRWGAGIQSSICCRFEPELVSKVVEDRRWTGTELDASLDIRSSVVRDVLVRLAREVEAPGFCAALLAESLCTQLLIELGRYFQGAGETVDTGAARLSVGQMRHIEERLEAPGKAPSIAMLAAESGLSTRHFFRMFKLTTGTTVSEFAIARRIARAKALLADRAPRVKEVAYRCGFETPAAFSAAFRRVTGVTPRQYRREIAA